MTANAPRSASKCADVQDIRAHFPATQRTHNGFPVAFLDGPGGTQVPQAVVDAMADYLLHHNANTHWNYPTSAETDAMLMAAREAMADFLGGSVEEVAFGANMTTLTFHLSRALGRDWGEDDVIVTTELDHHGNVAPWRRLAKERGVRIRSVKMDPVSGTLDWSDLEAALASSDGRIRLLAIGAASNALGTITDVRAASALAKRVGALVFVDAVHYAPHVLVDVRSIGCDFLACSAYKFYGPHVGVLWGRRDLIDALDVPKLDPAPSYSPEKLETGTQNHEGIVGAGAAVDWLASLASHGSTRRERLGVAMEELHTRSASQFRRLSEGLASLDGVTRYGPPPGAARTGTLSFIVDGWMSDGVAGELAKQGLFVSHGDFYAATVIERLGNRPDGIVRVGTAAYTTDDEIDRTIDAVARLARRTNSKS